MCLQVFISNSLQIDKMIWILVIFSFSLSRQSKVGASKPKKSGWTRAYHALGKVYKTKGWTQKKLEVDRQLFNRKRHAVYKDGKFDTANYPYRFDINIKKWEANILVEMLAQQAIYKFTIGQRIYNGLPTMKVTFENGFKDSIELNHFMRQSEATDLLPVKLFELPTLVHTMQQGLKNPKEYVLPNMAVVEYILQQKNQLYTPEIDFHWTNKHQDIFNELMRSDTTASASDIFSLVARLQHYNYIDVKGATTDKRTFKQVVEHSNAFNRYIESNPTNRDQLN